MLSIVSEFLEEQGPFVRYACATTLLVVITFLTYEYIRWVARIPKFGGPLGLPIVGNLYQIRREDAPEQYRIWAQKYGPVYQVQLGNIPVLVINSAAAAKAILIQNSTATASRPEFYTFHKIISDTSGTTIGTSPYTESLKRRRKAGATALNRSAVASYVPHLDKETRVFLREALEYGKNGKEGVNPMPLFLRMNLSIGLTIHWGSRMETQSDLFREIIYVEDRISNFRSTTGNLQDYIPPLRLNPFSSDSSDAKDMRIRRDNYMSLMDRDLDDKMEKRTHKPCIRANVKLDEETKLGDVELTSLNLTMLAAGLDTMNSAVSWGIAMLATMPEIQKAAVHAIREHYAEDDPLCAVEDDQKIEYLNIMIKEILRYYTVTRLSLPRQTTSDFVYDNKLIPKGSIIFLNAWACNMDHAIWSDPETFRPERWLEQPDAPIFTFGVGSRMCIGTQIAYRELYLLFLRLINSFQIDADGYVENHPIRGVANPASLTTQPKTYRVKFIPRDSAALAKALQTTP